MLAQDNATEIKVVLRTYQKVLANMSTDDEV